MQCMKLFHTAQGLRRIAKAWVVDPMQGYSDRMSASSARTTKLGTYLNTKT